MKKASESAVDRLIALALDEKPSRPSADHEVDPVPMLGDPELPSPRELEHNPIWQGLLQLRAFLPYVARALEVGGAAQASTALTAEVRRSVGALENAQHDMRESVAEQIAELKRVEQTVARTQEATDRNTSELTELGDDVKSMRTLMKVAVGILMFLVLALTGTVILLLARLPHR
ncbi:MAG: hypothetical protein WBD46_16640 [Acidobacteriaceae bacterium]